MTVSKMSWRSSFAGCKFRQVLGKPASRERSYDGVPITCGVHDNHYCSANPRFIAVVTESGGGGSFLVIPIQHTGRLDPQQPRVCGHRAGVLDVKWNPFDDHCIASCSEDCTVKIWDIPVCGVQQNLTQARKTLMGHSRRVGLIEWHPTAQNLLLSSAYDYKVLLWDVSVEGAELRCPARVVMTPLLQRFPSEALLLSVSFNWDGSRLAVTSQDRRLRVLDPRSGRILQVSGGRSHRANKVLYLGGLKLLLSTGCSRWNHRQMVLWDPDDLSEPLYEEDVDGSAGVLFPFYDADTHMLYLAGKGDGTIRSYEVSTEKPFISFLMEFRSLLPQKGLGVMPKRGLDVAVCEVFRFYRLIAVKELVEPVSIIVPRRKSASFQEDLYPLTAGGRAAMTAQEWLSGVNRGPLLMSLRPGSPLPNPYPEPPPARAGPQARRRPATLLAEEALPAPAHVNRQAAPVPPCGRGFLEEQLAYQRAKYRRRASQLSAWQPDDTQAWTHRRQPHHTPPPPPPHADSQLLQVFYRQQEEIRDLRQQLSHREVRIAQLEQQINATNDMRATA